MSQKLAQVIVDVPTMQTNVPYTYLIPDRLKPYVQRGMRVVVPFGHRRIQGFIVGFQSHSKYRLKPINALMDISPVVNTELLDLSKWLAATTFSFRISCLQAMLPTVMKARYKKEFILNKPTKDKHINRFFGKAHRIICKPNQLSKTQIYTLLKLRRKNLISVRYLVENQAKSLKVLKVRNILTPKRLSIALKKKIRTNAVGQKALINFFIKHPGKYQVATITKRPHISIATVRACAKKGLVKLVKEQKLRNPYKQPVIQNKPLKLNKDQEHAYQQIIRAIHQNSASVFLLEGVTGSGKTEVYMQAMQEALNRGKTALMLVPEISLTPQTVRWIKGRFGNLVAILHSGLSSGERFDEWRRINSGKAKIVVGTRSAIFAPLKNLGLIVLDEEHDESYKQESVPRYQTRVIAKWRGKYNHCPVVLGSATPCLESRARAMKGVYTLLRLPHRANKKPLPQIHVINMRKQMQIHKGTNYSLPLLNAIKTRLKKHEQVILMLNRRGFSSFIMCRNCGYVPKCPNCDITLTLHLSAGRLECHYCGYSTPIPRYCPKCHSQKIKYVGSGTEQAEMELKRLIPGIRVIRMDVDTTKHKGAHAQLFSDFRHHKADVLLGTQMIAKGLDFPNVTLVGVLNADTSLFLPNFRSAEDTFQLLVQVSGRAGRSSKKGEVYIQTFHPDDAVIQLAKQQNYEKFYRYEMTRRHQHKYPPYYFIVRIVANSRNKYSAKFGIQAVKERLLKYLSPSALLLGPAPCAISKIKNHYYYQLVLKYQYEPYLQKALDYVLNHYQKTSKRGLYIDIDKDPRNLV